MTRPIGAVLVGGASRRMGGAPKGLLVGPSGEPVAAALCGLLERVCDEIVLVGDAPAYRSLGRSMLPDASPGRGPLGGLVAALAHAGQRRAIVLACDMPFVTPGLLERLAAAPSRAPVVAAARGPGLEPLFARYDAPRALPVARARLLVDDLALRGLLDALGAAPLELDALEAAALDDWDRPADVARWRGARR